MILVQESLVNKILKNLYLKFGNNSDAVGIFFTLPVSHVSDNLLKQYQTQKESED